MSEKKIISFTWDDFMNDTKEISKYIDENFKGKNIGLLGVARGGLPVLTRISHLQKNKNIAVVHVMITDENDVYNESNDANIYSEFYKDGIDDYIILEDIIITGKSTEIVARRLKEMNKNVCAICSLCRAMDFENKYFTENNIPLMTCHKTDRNDWIEFPWEISE